MKHKIATAHVKQKWLIRHEAYQIVVTRMQVHASSRMTFNRSNTKVRARKTTLVSVLPTQDSLYNPSCYGTISPHI